MSINEQTTEEIELNEQGEPIVKENTERGEKPETIGESSGRLPEVPKVEKVDDIKNMAFPPPSKAAEAVVAEQQKRFEYNQHLMNKSRKKLDSIFNQLPEILKQFEYTYAIDEALQISKLALNKCHVAILQSPVRKPEPKVVPPVTNRSQRRKKK